MRLSFILLMLATFSAAGAWRLLTAPKKNKAIFIWRVYNGKSWARHEGLIK